MKCFHHGDADGKCAAFWVSERFPHMTANDYILIDYGMDIDWFSKFEKDEPIIIVDFSFEPEDMRKILTKTTNVTWIDHHKSAIEKYKDFETEIKGLRYDGIAGCMLTWAYYNKMNDGRYPFDPKYCTEAPWMTKYIADHDVWKYEFGDETAHFKLGLDAIKNTDPTNPIWTILREITEVRRVIKEGAIIQRYRDSIGERACERYGFEYDFNGVKGFVLNNVFGGSEWFVDLVKEYDVVCAFHYMGKDKLFEYSLYSEKDYIDCASLVQKIFGPESGGHKGAAGGVSKELLFTKQ